MPLSPGTRFGVYEVSAKIGEGGMGQVYQARDTKLDRDVALKVLPEAFTSQKPLGRPVRDTLLGATGMRRSTVVVAWVVSLGLVHAPSHANEPHVGVGPPSAPLKVAQAESNQRRILFVADWERKEEIYVMEPDGSNVQRLTTTMTGTGSWQPVWSPNGSRIAFGSDRDGNNEIYVMNADGSNVRRLTHTPDEEQTPNWSPDGKQIVFAATTATGGAAGIDVVNADGTNTRRLAHWEYVYVIRPVWSPDGGRIAFSSGVQFPDGEWESDIYVMDADGSDVQRLTQHAGVNYQASWSPNGEQLVFDSTRDGNYEIYVMDADGSNVTRLTQNETVDARPDWSSDGTKIAFHSRRSHPPPARGVEVYVMDADGSNVTRLTYGDAFARHPDW